MIRLIYTGIIAIILNGKEVFGTLPCGEIHRDLSLPCRCDVRPTNLLEQGIGVLMDCDQIVFPGEVPVLPHGAPIIGFSQRSSGHQTLPTQMFSRSELPIQKLDFSYNSLRRLTDRLFTSVADTLEELYLSDNLLGDNLNPIFSSSEFHGLDNLKVLDLSGNQIRGLEEGIFRGCINLQELRLDRNLLTSVPGQSLNGPRNLRSISLTENRIKVIKSGVFSSQRNLVRIKLDGNELGFIEGGAFAGLNKLREISLSVNRFSRFNSDVFTGVENLEKLDLSQNYFTEFPQIALKSIPHLKSLNLSSNLIRTLGNSNLDSLLYIETLDLSRNNIASIQPGTFLHLRKLKRLSLSVNSLRTIEDDAFEGLDNLEALSLEDNNVLLIPASALGRLPKLTHLNLSYNRISALSREILRSIGGKLVSFSLARNVIREIPAGAFQDLKHLKRLELNGNSIAKIDGETFVGLDENLEYLSLAQNKLSSLSGPPLALAKLTTLDLSENQIHDLPWTAFTLLPNLRYLNLSSNARLETLPSTIFHSSAYLSSLDLSSCGVKNIHPELLLHSLNLKTLRLSANSLQNISESTFRSLYNLTYLDLSENKIATLRAGSLGHCPNLKVLLLNGNRLNAFKGEYFKIGKGEFKNLTNLEILNISDNELSYLFPSSFKIHPKIKVIIANNNKFTFFPAELIANLQFLESIDLSNNQLKAIEDMDFSRLPRLRELILHNNEIESVSESAFHNSTQLQVLDLSKNKISRIGERTFEGLLRIEMLNLHDNLLSDLPETIFERSKLQMLENINLSKNKFVNPPLKSLQRQYFFLSSVDLSNNNIKEISPEDVTMVNIKKLDLSFNPLSKESVNNVLGEPKTVRELNLAGVNVKDISHLEMPFLNKLNLSHNIISKLDDKIFERSTLLEHLDISNNKITDFSNVLVWKTLKALRHLDISGNLVNEVSAGQFDGLENLRVLNMQDFKNTMKIEKNAFKFLTSLKELRAYNYPRLGYLDVQGILQYLPTLELLDVELKDATITSEELTYVMHPRLQYLGLRGKQITSISTGAFAGLKSPKINLKLVNTSVTNLPQGLFFPLPRSSDITFDVAESKISSLSPQFLAMLEDHRKHLTLIGLDSNPIKCDCHTKPLKRWIMNNKNAEVICQNEDYLNQSLRDIPEEDLSCDVKRVTETTTTSVKPTPIITKTFRKSTTESDIIWSLSPKNKKTTLKPPKIITSMNTTALNNDDMLIIGIVGGVVAFIIILVIVICIIRLRMINNQYQGGALASPMPYGPPNPCIYPVKPGHPNLYVTPTYATLPHKVMNQSMEASSSSLKHYPTLRPPSQLQSYYQSTPQNQSAYYIPYTPDEKIEYR